MGPGAVGDVVIDAHGEGVGLLEHHAHLLAQIVDLRLEDVRAVVEHLPGDPYAGDQVVHPVQGFEERGLAAAGGADEGGDGFFGDVDADIFQRLGLTVPQVQTLDGNNRFVQGNMLLS